MRKKSKSGQALVEVALIFPIFLIVVFGVMQMGHLAAMTIIVNHATFEIARIGAISSEGFRPGERASCSSAKVNVGKMTGMARQIFERWPGEVVEPIQHRVVPTLQDPEAKRPNCDLVVTLQYQLPLVFPFVNLFFAQPPLGGYDPDVGMYRLVVGESRMPLEVPIWGDTSGSNTGGSLLKL